MRVFKRLRALWAFDEQHLDFLGAGADRHLVVEIGYHQATGTPLTLKQLFLLGVGSVATVQRRLRRLKGLGLLQHRRSATDRRAVELTLSPRCLQIFAKYDALMTSNPPRGGAGGPGHVCGLCDSNAGRRNLLVAFLSQGLKRGDKCLLVASADARDEILAALEGRRKAPRHLVTSEGFSSADAYCAFLKRVSKEAKQAGRTMRLASDMSWTLSRKLPVDAVLDVERRLDALARHASLAALCVYDARHFSSGDFLRAVKCHRDHSRHPIVLG